MSSTITFLPIDHESSAIVYSHTILTCDESSALSAAIAEILAAHGQPVPALFQSLAVDAFEVDEGSAVGTTQDVYGQPLRWVPAHTLRGLALHMDVATRPRTRAVWGYLGAMTYDGKVVIYEY